MNAYELAYFIDKYCEDNTSKEAAVLLLQQADHINELDILLDKKYAVIKQQADRIAMLENKLNQMEEKDGNIPD